LSRGPGCCCGAAGGSGLSAAKRWAWSGLDSGTSEAAKKKILLVGPSGAGKSSIVRGLAELGQSEPEVGRDPRGVTKTAASYLCKDGEGALFELIDTPGVGDFDISPLQLISMIETQLVRSPLEGVVVTVPVADQRISLAQQLVQILLDLGLTAPGIKKYDNVILCGTKLDKADEEDMRNFMEGFVDRGHPSVKEMFFRRVGRLEGLCVMVDQRDYSPLQRAIGQLPPTPVVYAMPDARELAAALAAPMGVDPGAFAVGLEVQRLRREMQVMSEEFDCERARMTDMAERMRQEFAQHLDQQTCHHKREAEQLRGDIGKQLAQQRAGFEAELEQMGKDFDQQRVNLEVELARARKKLRQQEQRHEEYLWYLFISLGLGAACSWSQWKSGSWKP